MGDASSDEDFPDEWVFYARRREWADVTPIPQDDGENPVVVIAYSEKFKDVYDYFRAIVAKSEKSERALELTKDALKLNAANYTVWQYRRDILKYLNKDLEEELNYIEEIIEDNVKNYQVWHHRRVIVEWLNDASKELELTKNILNMDAKNYHAWQHRQWAIKAFNLFDDELTYVDKLISEDLRNNSAWNQRFFVLKHTGFTFDILRREVNYAMTRIRIVKNNESSWNFLRGVLQQEDGTLDQLPEVEKFCDELYDAGNRSPYLLAFMIDMYMEKCLTNSLEDDLNKLSKKSLDLCDSMGTKYDTIRCKYWKYVSDTFQKKMTRADRQSVESNNSTNGDFSFSSS